MEAITQDSMTQDTQLSEWVAAGANTASVRVLNFHGVTPLSESCGNPSKMALASATMMCRSIGIESFTQSFVDAFERLQLNAPEVLQSINVLQLDYADQFPLETIAMWNFNNL